MLLKKGVHMVGTRCLLSVVAVFFFSTSGCLEREGTCVGKVDQAAILGQNLASCREDADRLAGQSEDFAKKLQAQQEQIGRIEKSGEEKVRTIRKTYA